MRFYLRGALDGKKVLIIEFEEDYFFTLDVAHEINAAARSETNQFQKGDTYEMNMKTP